MAKKTWLQLVRFFSPHLTALIRIARLTDECQAPLLILTDWTKQACGETTIREPLYVLVAFIHTRPMGHFNNIYNKHIISNFVNDAVKPLSNSVIFFA